MRLRLRDLVLTVIVIGAGIRAMWVWRREPVDRAVRTLRAVRPLPKTLRHPEALLRLVNAHVMWLPPFGLRACMKRSLLLLDLWSRCGLDPVFHLGVAVRDDGRDGHAWVSAEGFESEDVDRYPEAYRY